MKFSITKQEIVIWVPFRPFSIKKLTLYLDHELLIIYDHILHTQNNALKSDEKLESSNLLFFGPFYLNLSPIRKMWRKKIYIIFQSNISCCDICSAMQ